MEQNGSGAGSNKKGVELKKTKKGSRAERERERSTAG